MDNTKGAQSQNGFWITSNQIATSKKKGRTIGVVRVSEDNLIPDGIGGYFVHVTHKDIDRTNVNSFANNYRPYNSNFNTNYEQNVRRQNNPIYDDHGPNGNGNFANRGWRITNFDDRVSDDRSR